VTLKSDAPSDQGVHPVRVCPKLRVKEGKAAKIAVAFSWRDKLKARCWVATMSFNLNRLRTVMGSGYNYRIRFKI